jgi:DNA-directed RNA polymerase specialized sigma24 family protein
VRREILSFVERILREYPDRVRELEMLDNAITAACRPGGYSTSAGASGEKDSEQERILDAKERNRDYKWLEQHVAVVGKVLSRLAKEERDLIRLLCWEEHTGAEIAEIWRTDIRTVWRTRRRALEKTARIFPTSSLIRPKKDPKVSLECTAKT